MKTIFIATLSLLFHLAYGQVQKECAMDEVFQKEFADYIDSSNSVCLSTPPVVLPAWFFNPPKGDKEFLYVIGISDPWIDSRRGNKQAKSRACCLASFMNNVSAKGVSDLYNRNEQNYKFEQICHFNALANTGFEGVPIDSFVTKYQEQIFLYKFTAGNSFNPNNSFIEYYKSVMRYDAGYNQLEKFELFCQTTDATIRYEYAVKDNDFEILSVFNSDTIAIKPTIYQYAEKNNSIVTDSVTEISLFKKGLWQGFFKSLIDQLDLAASDIATRQKSVSESIQNGIKNLNYNELNRGVYNTSFSFVIASIELANKEMTIHLKANKNQ